MAPWNGSGTFGLSDTVTDDTDATADEVNSIFTDLANGINACLNKNGENALANPLKLPSGSAANPSLAFSADTNTGLFRKSADELGVSAGGTEVASFPSTGPVFDPGLPTDSIADAAVTYAKIQNVSATDKILGRSSSGAGAVEEIACTSVARTLLSQATQALMRSVGLGLGTSSTVDTGTSGTKVPLLDGDNTHSGANTFSNAAGVSAKNTAKAFASFGVSGTTVSFTKANNFNIESITRTGEGTFTVAFTMALPTANYVVIGAGLQEGATIASVLQAASKQTTGFTLNALKSQETGTLDPAQLDFAVFGI